MFQLRLLPLTMIATGMLLAIKTADLIHGGQEFGRMFSVSSVNAQAADTTPAAPAAAPADQKPAESGSSTGGSSSGTPAASPTASTSGSSGAASASSGSSTGGSSSGSEEKKPKEEGNAKDPKAPKEVKPSAPPTAEELTGGRGLTPGSRYFSPIELEILQTLDKRRETLDQWAADLEVKENLLSITEKRIDGKISEIQDLKKDLEELLNKYNTEEDSHIKSLVKIYETMAPKDAAHIFDGIEMPVLLNIIDHMAEKKASPILAAMDPKKAELITVQLAEQHKLKPKTKPPGTTAPVQGQ